MVFTVTVVDARPHRPRRPRKPPQKIQVLEKQNPYKFVKNFDVLLLKYSDENLATINRINTEAMKYHHVTRAITYPDSQIPILVSQFTYEKLIKDKINFLRLSPSIEAGDAIQTDIAKN